MAEPPVVPDPPPGLPSTWRERVEALGAGAPLTPARVAAGAVTIVVAVAVGVLALRGPSPPVELTLPMAGGPGDTSASTITTLGAPPELLVHAAGAVQAPGVYRLRSGARVSDLVDAAGGPSPEGDLDRLNLAAPVADGQQVYVPRLGEAVPGPTGDGSGAGADGGGSSTPGGLVDINTASADQLDTLPGVGPATAQAILDERERRGRFDSVEELIDVRGIGDAKLEALRDLVRV